MLPAACRAAGICRYVAQSLHNPDGRFFPLPVPNGTTGIDQAIRSTVAPLRADLPILVGAFGPRNVAMTAEVADGWLIGFLDPARCHVFRPWLDEGFARAGARRTWQDFEIVAAVTTIVDDDVVRAAATVRQTLALYIGAMGLGRDNFQYRLFVRMGWEAEANRILALWQEGRQQEAVAAVPMSMVDATALVGPKERIRDQLAKWRESFVTTFVVRGDLLALRTVAELLA